jgi:hypothetical protein
VLCTTAAITPVDDGLAMAAGNRILQDEFMRTGKTRGPLGLDPRVVSEFGGVRARPRSGRTCAAVPGGTLQMQTAGRVLLSRVRPPGAAAARRGGEHTAGGAAGHGPEAAPRVNSSAAGR